MSASQPTRTPTGGAGQVDPPATPSWDSGSAAQDETPVPVSTVARRVRVESGIYRRGDGALEIGWRDMSGKQRWRVVPGTGPDGRGITAARAALSEALADRARGVQVAADPRLRFSDAAQAWWDARVVRLRESTQQGYAASLAHLKRPEFFGRSRLSEITASDVARYVARQQAAGLKGWTLRSHLSVLSAVFSFAARHLGYAGANPVSLLDRVERPSSEDERPKRILSGDELARLLAAVPDRHRLVFELGAETGARVAEVLGLVWDDVDLESETVTFTHQLDRRRRKRRALKTKRSRRCLEVTPALVARLRAHRLQSPHSQPHDFVFSTSTGLGQDQRNVAGRVLSRAVERAGLCATVELDGGRLTLTAAARRELGSERVGRAELIVPAPTFHDLRHTHASRLIAAGWDIEEVSARLGHANVATTQRIYVHEFDAANRSADRRSRLAALYGSQGDDQVGIVTALR